MLRMDLDYKDSDAKITAILPVDAKLIFDVDFDEDGRNWWDTYKLYENAGVFTNLPFDAPPEDEAVLKWAISTSNDNLDEFQVNKVRAAIETVCADPSRWVKGTWTVSLWVQSESKDLEVKFIVVNPNA